MDTRGLEMMGDLRTGFSALETFPYAGLPFGVVVIVSLSERTIPARPPRFVSADESLRHVRCGKVQFMIPSEPSVARLAHAAPSHPYRGMSHRFSTKFKQATASCVNVR